MAITTPKMTGEPERPIERDDNRWAVNYSGNFVAHALNVELKAAPTRAGSASYLTHVTMGITRNPTFTNHTPDGRLTLVDGGGVEVFGPIQFEEKGQTLMSKDFKYPLKLTNKKALDLTGAGAGSGYQASCFVYIEGFTGDKPLG